MGLTTLLCKKENCLEASKKFSRILWRRSRPRLGCEAKERSYELITLKILFTDTFKQIMTCSKADND
jgi:hypothetical protein